MRKKRKFYGAKPKGDSWVPSGEFFSCDDTDWTIYYSLRCSGNGYANFKVFSIGSVKSKANYWVGMNKGRTFNSDAMILRLRPELHEWAMSVMDRIYSQNVGPREVIEVAA